MASIKAYEFEKILSTIHSINREKDSRDTTEKFGIPSMHQRYKGINKLQVTRLTGFQ